MTKEVFRQQEARLAAKAPVEVERHLAQLETGDELIRGWYSIPTLRKKLTRVSRESLLGNEADAVETLRPFFGQTSLEGSVRIMDALNGCGHQCDTCIADAVVPSAQFSYESSVRLWQMPEFLAMLQPDSFRFGSSGDILNHPQGVEIVEMALDATRHFPDYFGGWRGKSTPYKVKVMTNYRPNLEEQLDRLLVLACEHQQRLTVCVSLPLNQSDEINRRFDQYVAARPRYFGGDYRVGEDGLVKYFASNGLKNIYFMDVRHPVVLFMWGRRLSDPDLELKGKHVARVDVNRETEYRARGMVKPYLNADGLWLMVYVTARESHTTRIFTPMTSENLEILTQLPFHPDFPTPPNWPGGRGVEYDYFGIREMMKQEGESAGPIRSATTV